MSQDRSLNQRSAVFAAGVASVLMVAFGLGYRAVAARVESPVDATPVAQEALDRLPLQIGAWAGQDTPLDEAVIKATDTDAHINRQYVSSGGLGAVSLWIASGVRARDLMPHRPEVCYTGSGFTLVARQSPDLPLADGGVLPCNAMQFSRGTLAGNRVLVLYYYLVDGQYCRDVAEWRYKVIWTPIGYIAQVQVITAISDTTPAEVAMRQAAAFATESAPLIAALFQDEQAEADPD